MTQDDNANVSRLEQRLIECERRKWGSAGPLSDRMRPIKNLLRNLLDSRTIRLPYTPHGFEHALEVDALADDILNMSSPEASIQGEPYSLFILTLAIWFHDSGLVQLSDSETSEEIRRNHHLRIGLILKNFFGDLLDDTEVSFIRDIGRNHCENNPDVLPRERHIDRRILPPPNMPTKSVIFPRLSSAILRLADILSITNTRTPWFLYRHLDLNHNSLKHWRSHLSIESLRLQAAANEQIEIVVSLGYSSKDLLQFIETQVIAKVEQEIRTCNPVIQAAGLKAFCPKVHLDLNEHGLGAQGTFGVLPSGLYDLLINGLYGHLDVFVRELVQNGFDATTRQKAIGGHCSPDELLITVEYGQYGPEETQARIRKISFRDYGIGMDQGDIDTYLLQIAAKASDNPDLNRIVAAAGLDPLLQQWGIGFLSVFAVTTDVTLRTHKDGMRPVKLEFHAREGSSEPDGYAGGIYCTIKEDTEPLSSTPRGTEISLRFADGLDLDVLERLQHYVRYPPTVIRYTDNMTPPRSETLNERLTNPGDQTISLPADFLRGGWIALAGDEYRTGVSLTQSGILVEEHVTDLLDQEGLDIRGEIDCRSRFLDLPASRSQAIRGTESWKMLREQVLEAIPDCVRAHLTRPICVNAPLPRALLKVTDAVDRFPAKVRDRLLEVLSERSIFRFDDDSEVRYQDLAACFPEQNDATVYLVSRGSTADGSSYLRGHYSVHGTPIFMSATLAHGAKAELLRAQGKRLLPIAPKSWTLGTRGYENEWLIRSLCAKAGIRIKNELISESDKRAEYKSLATDDFLRSMWNKADWSDLGEAVKAICVAHEPWKFVFVIGSGTPTVQKLRALWQRNTELRPLFELLLHSYCESLRVNPDAVVAGIEEFVESETMFGHLLRRTEAERAERKGDLDGGEED